MSARYDPFADPDLDDPADELHRARDPYRGQRAAEVVDVTDTDAIARKAAKEQAEWEARDEERTRAAMAEARAASNEVLRRIQRTESTE